MISELTKEFRKKFSATIKIGAEIEFYLRDFTNDKFNNFSERFKNIELEKEKGANQFEVKVKHDDDLQVVIDEINDIRMQIIEEASRCGMEAIFAGKPFLDQPGSAMQLNISLHKNSRNLFSLKDSRESNYLLYSLGGLCSTMLQNMVYFIPNEEGYSRLEAKTNAPTTVSWGSNNRTVALRVPTTNSVDRRIEHRVPSADSDPEQVIKAIIDGTSYGIANNLLPPPKIYGDASDEQYSLKKLPKSLLEAQSYML